MPGPHRILAVLLLLPLGCGGSVPTLPSVMPTPTNPGGSSSVVNIAGNWNGTVAADNFTARPVTLVIVQTDSCVDGEWKDATGEVRGAISGLASADGFSGQISFERSESAGGKCQAGANVSGTVQGDSFRWTAGPMTAVGNCAGGVPQNLVLAAQR